MRIRAGGSGGSGAAAGWLFVLIASVYLLTAAGRFANYDAESMFSVTRSLYERGSLDVGACVPKTWTIACVPGVDGRFYSGYGVIPSVAAVPFYAAGRSAGSIIGFNQDLAGAVAVAFMNAFVGALACVALFLWALRIGCSERQSVLAAILLAFATPFWFHSTKELYSEPLFTLFIVGAFAALSRPTRRSAVAAGVLFGLAIGTRVFGLIYLPIAGVYSMLASARSVADDTSDRSARNDGARPAIWFLISALVCIAGVGIVNQLRFGSPFNTGYHIALPTLGSLFSTPFFTGLRGNLFDANVGLVWYAPLVLLVPFIWRRFHREHPLESFVCLAVTISSVVFFSVYTYWYGGWSYGPRLLTPVLPFLILPLTPILSGASEPDRSRRLVRRVALVLIALAVAIQLVGVIPPYTRHYYLRAFYETETPRPLWHRSALLENVEDLPGVMSYVTESHGADDKAAALPVRTAKDRYLVELPNSINQLAPDIWWLKAGVLGMPWRYLISIAVILCLCAVAAASRIRRINA